MKNYIIQQLRQGLLLTCEALVKGRVQKQVSLDSYDIGNSSKGTKALALAILLHYYGADAGGQAEAQRRAQSFMDAFLIHHQMPLNAKLEISSDVIDRFFSLQ